MLEWLLKTLAEKVIGYAFDQSGLKEKISESFKRDATADAFWRSLQKTFSQFERRYPQLAAEDLFNPSLHDEYIPILAQFLLLDGHPNPSDLASLWADALYKGQPEKRAVSMRKLEPIAVDFLDSLNQTLRTEPALRALQDSQAGQRTVNVLESIARDITSLRQRLESNRATPGTRRDYLHWLVERNLYLDPRGTYQTERQVQVKLEDVYISLRAQREELLREVDRYLIEQELAQVKQQRVQNQVSAEEAEDLEERIVARYRLPVGGIKGGVSEVLELSAAARRHAQLVILGDPGSGKSTLLRYLALKHAQASLKGQVDVGAALGPVHFPILVRIADYAVHGMRQGKSLSTFLLDSCLRYECPEAGLTDLLATALREGHCLVLLDGLDEVVSAEERLAVVRQIEEFVRHHDQGSNRFIITSRIAGYRNARLSGTFVHYTVQEMNEAQMHQFLEAWCPAVEAAQTPDLSAEARACVAQREIDGIMRAVQTTPGVRRLAANPLLLRTRALIHRTGARLPQKRIELYKLVADTLARTWRLAQEVPASALVEETYLTRLLSKLAYWMHVNKPTGIATEQEAYRELGQEWARLKKIPWDEDDPEIEMEVKKFLQQVREHTGLFVERTPKRYGFMHLTFEEYYAARYLIARSKTRAQLIRQHLHDPRWDEPILLALGFVGLDSPDDASELVETAILAQGELAEESGFRPSPYEDLLGRDYLFALRCLGDQIPIDAALMRQLLQRLANEYLHSTGLARFAAYRQALDRRLSYLRGSNAEHLLLPHLLAAFKDADSDVRRQAAGSLGQLGAGSAEVVSALLAALKDADSNVRGQVAGSLGEVGQGEETVLQALCNGLLDTEHQVRTTCSQALVRLGFRFSERKNTIEKMLVQAIQDSAFDRLSRLYKRTGHDYAFDGLCQLVVGSEEGEESS